MFSRFFLGDDMKELTKAEEQIMLILWEKEKAFVKEIIEDLPEPKPAYTTVSTIVRILETKGFVGHNDFGKTHQYFPIVLRDEYATKFVNGFVKDYFASSFKQLVSFFSSKEDMSLAELEEIKKIVEQEINNKKE